MRYLGVTALFALLFAAGPQLTAQTSPDAEKITLSVAEAVALALEQHPELQQRQAAITIKQLEAGPAWGIERPELYYGREGIGDGAFQEQQWGISQSIQFPLTGYYAAQEVKQQELLAERQYAYSIQNIKKDVKQAYIRLAYARKQHDLANRQQELMQRLYEIASLRREAGDIADLDLIEAEVRLDQSRQEVRMAEARRETARQELLTAMGLLSPEESADSPETAALSFPDTLSYTSVEISREALIQQRDQTPLARIAGQESAVAEAGLRLAKQSYWPDLQLNYYRQDFGNGYDFDGIELGISIPLWFTFNERNRTKQARLSYGQAQARQQQTRIMLQEDAEAAWQQYASSRERILSYRDGLQQRTAELLRLAREGYRQGELSLMRVLQAQETYLEGERRYHEALLSYHLQLAELERFTAGELIFTE